MTVNNVQNEGHRLPEKVLDAEIERMTRERDEMEYKYVAIYPASFTSGKGSEQRLFLGPTVDHLNALLDDGWIPLRETRMNDTVGLVVLCRRVEDEDEEDEP